MSMNAELADYYSTPGSEEVNEDLEKQASVENFAKLASKHGIDLTQMDDEEVNALYAEVYPDFSKTAMQHDDDEEEDDEDEDKDKKKESASYHFQEKRAFQEKFAEADFMGRVMAHSFTQEIDSIEKTAKKGPGTRLGETVARQQKRKGMTSRGPLGPTGRTEAGAKAMVEGSGKKPYASLGSRLKSYGRRAGAAISKHPGRAAGVAAGLGAAGVAGSYLAGKKKKASVDFEEISANHAVKMASSEGYDADQVHELVESVWKLGLEETEKVASVQSFDDAIHVRGLEYLEAAGYDVDWSEVFG